MDNITHSLVGAAIAELALPASATSDERRVLMAGAVIAANLPDIDLAYTWITPAPLGYLLHHRGYTHTVAGLLALSVALPLVMRLWPAVRGLGSRAREWLWGLVAVNLLGHVALDGLNCVRRAPVLSVRVAVVLRRRCLRVRTGCLAGAWGRRGV